MECDLLPEGDDPTAISLLLEFTASSTLAGSDGFAKLMYTMR